MNLSPEGKMRFDPEESAAISAAIGVLIAIADDIDDLDRQKLLRRAVPQERMAWALSGIANELASLLWGEDAADELRKMALAFAEGS